MTPLRRMKLVTLIAKRVRDVERTAKRPLRGRTVQCYQSTRIELILFCNEFIKAFIPLLTQERNAKMEKSDADKTHPGFTITCDKCGSSVCYVENSLGWSETSGGWGSVDIVCGNCDAHVEIVGS